MAEQRFFNTTGPCRPEDHYMVPAAARLGLIRRYIDRKQYVVLHAARQAGKTTALADLARELVAEGAVAAALVSCEVGAVFPDPERAELAMLDEWRGQAGHTLPADLAPPPWPDAPAGRRIGAALAAWSGQCPRPLVLFLDEVDSLTGDALISMLRQLRSGFAQRPTGFPQSITLVGLRDVRDYLVAAGGSGRLGSSSPFNIKVESLTLTDFTEAEVGTLLRQHTSDTGQTFTDAAIARVFHLGGGQPWLTNALAAQLADVLVPDRARGIGPDDVDAAAEELVRRRDTHLDSLAVRLNEARVRAVIEPIISGGTLERVPEDDRQFVVDLGLVKRMNGGGLDIANPIYRNVLGRALASGSLDAMPRVTATWLDERGRLVPERLLAAFLEFWRRNAEPLFRAATYPEIAPHLVMMAFLDRVANGGGSVDREFAAGTGRIDLLLRYGEARMAFELKAWRDGRPDPVTEGLVQLDGYLTRLSLDTGWLVVFDARTTRASIEDRTETSSVVTPSGRPVTLIRG